MSHLAIELITYLRSNNTTMLWYDIRNKYSWRANRFARYLVNNNLKKQRQYGHVISSVSFDLVEQNAHLRKQKYSAYVLAAAKKYQISAALIYAMYRSSSYAGKTAYEIR